MKTCIGQDNCSSCSSAITVRNLLHNERRGERGHFLGGHSPFAVVWAAQVATHTSERKSSHRAERYQEGPAPLRNRRRSALPEVRNRTGKQKKTTTSVSLSTSTVAFWLNLPPYTIEWERGREKLEFPIELWTVRRRRLVSKTTDNQWIADVWFWFIAAVNAQLGRRFR